MKKILFKLPLFLLISICSAQEKIPEKYIVQVTYISGNTEVIPVKNFDMKANVPAPIVKDGSIFYDEEYLLLDVKKIKILNIIYAKNASTSKSKYQIDTYYYWSYKYGKYMKLNVITDPEGEKAQREVEAKARAKTKDRGILFERSDESQENDNNKSVDVIKEAEKSTVEKDTVIVSTEQLVCEVEGNGNISKIKNSTLRLEGNNVKYRFDEDLLQENFVKEDLDKQSEDYIILSQISLRKGIYIIEKKLNKGNEIISIKNVPVRLGN